MALVDVAREMSVAPKTCLRQPKPCYRSQRPEPLQSYMLNRQRTIRARFKAHAL
jgi:hypothetical protein